MKQLLAFLVMFLVAPFALHAQSVTTGALSTTSYCQGSTVIVNYTASGTFGAKNVFTVQLSAPNGSFSPSFQSIGQVKSTTSGTIAATLSVALGTHYRLRVAASNPYTVGNDNGSDITVGAGPYARILSSKKALLEGDAVTFFPDTMYRDAGTSYSWNFGDGANPATSTDSSVSVVYSTTGTKDVSLTVASPFGCSGSTTDSNVRVFSCNPTIPSSVFIDSVEGEDTTWTTSGDVWVVPGGKLDNYYHGFGITVYAEAGAIITSSESRVIYLKDGATYQGNNSGYGDVIIYAPGAGLNNAAGATLLPCSSLAFDYTNAPPYKMLWAGVTPSSESAPGVCIYPNPASNLVTIGSAEIPRAFIVRNDLGVVMLKGSGPLSTKQIEFDVSHFAPGAYYVALTLGNHSTISKFTISR